MSQLAHQPVRPTAARQSGFSLIEVMIAVVIVAVLAGVAFPSFLDSIRKGRRSEAFTALSAIQQAQERWRANKSSYASDLTSAAPAGLGLAATTPGGYYSITLTNVGDTGFEAVAVAVTGTSQANDGACAKLAVQLDGGNIRYASATSAGTLTYASSDKCWGR
jgi:type IV pilus assembly protein PilE